MELNLPPPTFERKRQFEITRGQLLNLAFAYVKWRVETTESKLEHNFETDINKTFFKNVIDVNKEWFELLKQSGYFDL